MICAAGPSYTSRGYILLRVVKEIRQPKKRKEAIAAAPLGAAMAFVSQWSMACDW
jgi:hypothetical protein